MNQEQKLSLVAQYDDLVRFSEQLIAGDTLEDKIRALLENCNIQRHRWLLERNELLEAKQEIKLLKKENYNLKINLKIVRDTYAKEVNLKEKYQNENNKLVKKLKQVQNYLLEEDTISKDSKTSLKEQLFSSFNAKLTTVMEENSNSDPSLSDLEFDKTEDDLAYPNISRHLNSTKTEKIDKQTEVKTIHDTVKDVEFENADENSDFSILDEDMVTDEPPIQRHTPLTKSTASIQSTNKLSSLSQSIMKKQQFKMPNELKIDNRPHCFVIKKVFRPEKCGPCGTQIGFYTSGYRCRDCRAICHTTCKDKVPLPCIPYVSRANIGKQGRLILISDFVPSNCKPCVPALIVHCTAEIERRGLDEVGIYRVPGSEKEVKELKEKILKSKQGIPSLTDTEVHVLCNVVKKFLNHLDEALIPRIAWRDFVELSTLENEEERKNRFREEILNLPNANRDTLAYMMLHLHKVADMTENKMTISNLAKVFGPTVLGYSMRDPPSSQIFEEMKKQIQVVELLLNLDDEFWQSILDLDRNYSYLTQTIRTTKCRPSVGSRLVGGKVNSGLITPLKPKNQNYNIKPLF